MRPEVSFNPQKVHATHRSRWKVHGNIILWNKKSHMTYILYIYRYVIHVVFAKSLLALGEIFHFFYKTLQLWRENLATSTAFHSHPSPPRSQLVLHLSSSALKTEPKWQQQWCPSAQRYAFLDPKNITQPRLSPGKNEHLGISWLGSPNEMDISIVHKHSAFISKSSYLSSYQSSIQ